MLDEKQTIIDRVTPLLDKVMDWKAYDIWTLGEAKIRLNNGSWQEPAKVAQQRMIYILEGDSTYALSLQYNRHLSTRNIHDKPVDLSYDKVQRIEEKFTAKGMDSTTLMIGLKMGCPNGLQAVYDSVRQHEEFATNFRVFERDRTGDIDHFKKLREAGLFKLSYQEIQGIVCGLAKEKQKTAKPTESFKTEHFGFVFKEVEPHQTMKARLNLELSKEEDRQEVKPKEVKPKGKPSKIDRWWMDFKSNFTSSDAPDPVKDPKVTAVPPKTVETLPKDPKQPDPSIAPPKSKIPNPKKLETTPPAEQSDVVDEEAQYR